MDARNWPALVRDLPLSEVAELLGIPYGHLLVMVADGVIAVCTRKPLQDGSWSVFNAYTGDPERSIHNRRPFNGRDLARLLESDAAECVGAGQVVVYSVRNEPRCEDVYVDEAYLRYFGPGGGTLITTDDLRVSRVEFEHFIQYFGFNYLHQPEQESTAQQVAEPVAEPAQAAPKPSHLLAIAGLLELLLDDSRPHYDQGSAAEAIEALHPDCISVSTLTKLFAAANKAMGEAGKEAQAKVEARHAAADRVKRRRTAKN